MFRDGSARLLVFRLGAERFAVALETVDEVVEAPAVNRVPDAPPTMLGVATLRGELVTMYDPRTLLRVGGDIAGAALLFQRNGRRVGFAVDDVYDVITVNADDLLAPPSSTLTSGLLLGLVRRGQDLIAVLDVETLLSAANAGAVEEEVR